MKHVVGAIVICVVLVAISVAFIDRPVERFVQIHVVHTQLIRLFQLLASPSLLSLPFVCIYLTCYTIAKATGRPPHRYTDLLLSICIATAVAIAAKDELKWAIGRPWPDTWVMYGIYKFHPFSLGSLYGGLPSGHTTYIAAPLFVLWWRVPQYRAIWISIIFIVMIGLVGGGYHFVGDVISGLFLGLAAATGTLAVWPKPRLVAPKV